MVTTAGLPHGVRYPVLAQPRASNNSSSVANILTEGILLNGNPYLKKPLGRNGYGTIPTHSDFYGHHTAGVLHSTSANSLKNQFGDFAETSFPSNSMFDDRVLAPTLGNKHAHLSMGVEAHRTHLTTADSDELFSTTVDRTYYDKPTNTKSTIGGSTHGADLFPGLPNRFKGVQSIAGQFSKCVPRLEEFGKQRADNTIWDVGYGQTVGGYTPMMWPAKQPCPLDILRKQVRDARRGVNTKNVQNYYANCKNIPVSIPVTLGGDDLYGKPLWGGDDKEEELPSKSHTRGERYSFRVSMKFYSCILGVFAKKWFPSLLIGAGKARIRMKLQQPNVLFQTLLDPCRIVTGTARDRFPYLGCFESTSTLEKYAENPVKNLAHGIHPILISNYVPGSCFNDQVALGKFPIPSLKMKAMSRMTDLTTTLDKRTMDRLANETHPNVPAQSTSAQTIRDYLGFFDLRNPADLETTSSDPQNIADALVWALTDVAHTDERLSVTTHTLTRALQNIVCEFSRNMMFGFPPMIVKNTTNLLDESRASRIEAHKKRNIVETTEKVDEDTAINTLTNYHWYTDLTPFFVPIGANGPWQPGAKSQQAVWKQGKNQAGTDVFFPNSTTSTDTNRTDYDDKGLWWDMFQFPTPQYVPMSSPWNKKKDRKYAKTDFVSEAEMCYGTYLPRSVAQVRRSNRQLFSLGTNYESYPGISERLTYSVMNVAYRCEEVILPEPASALIISSAMEGGITIEAETIKSIEQILQKQDNQKILLNVSAGLINDICFVFQPTEVYHGDKAYGYNSYAFYCPYTSFKFQKQSTDTRDGSTAVDGNDVPNSSADYNDLGGEPEFYNNLSFGDHIGIKTYVTISTEFFPRIPIDDLQTLIDHVCWGDQRKGDVEYLGLDPLIHNAYDNANFQRVLPFQDGFFSVFTPIETLDDQTMTGNPYWTPLEMSIKKRIRGRRSKHPALPFYKPFDGTFHLSMNLQPFMHQHERMNVGSPMVNTNAYLHMENCHMIREHETRMITFIRCFARVVIEKGGIVQIFT